MINRKLKMFSIILLIAVFVVICAVGLCIVFKAPQYGYEAFANAQNDGSGAVIINDAQVSNYVNSYIALGGCLSLIGGAGAVYVLSNTVIRIRREVDSQSVGNEITEDESVG